MELPEMEIQTSVLLIASGKMKRKIENGTESEKLLTLACSSFHFRALRSSTSSCHLVRSSTTTTSSTLKQKCQKGKVL